MPVPPVPVACARAPPGSPSSRVPAEKETAAPDSLPFFLGAQQFTIGKHSNLRSAHINRLPGVERRTPSRQQTHSRTCAFPSAYRATPARPPLRSPCETALARAYVRQLPKPSASSSTACGTRSTRPRNETSHSQSHPSKFVTRKGEVQRETPTGKVAGGVFREDLSVQRKASRQTLVTPANDSATSAALPESLPRAKVKTKGVFLRKPQSRSSPEAKATGLLAKHDFPPHDIAGISDTEIEEATEIACRKEGMVKDALAVLPVRGASKCLSDREQEGSPGKLLATGALEEGCSRHELRSDTRHTPITSSDNRTVFSLYADDRQKPSWERRRRSSSRGEDAGAPALPSNHLSPEGTRPSLHGAHTPEPEQKVSSGRRNTVEQDDRGCDATAPRSVVADERRTELSYSVIPRHNRRVLVNDAPADHLQQSSRRRHGVVKFSSGRGETTERKFTAGKTFESCIGGSAMTRETREIHTGLSLLDKDAVSTPVRLRKVNGKKSNESSRLRPLHDVPESELLGANQLRERMVRDVLRREDECPSGAEREAVNTTLNKRGGDRTDQIRPLISVVTGKEESLLIGGIAAVFPGEIRNQESFHTTLQTTSSADINSSHGSPRNRETGDRGSAPGRCSDFQVNNKTVQECSEPDSTPLVQSLVGTGQESTDQMCRKNSTDGIMPRQQRACLPRSSAACVEYISTLGDVNVTASEAYTSEKRASTQFSLSSRPSSSFSRPFFCTPSEKECASVDGATAGPRGSLEWDRSRLLSHTAGSVCSAFLTPPAIASSASSRLCPLTRRTDDTLGNSGLPAPDETARRTASSGQLLIEEAAENQRDSGTQHGNRGPEQMSRPRDVFISCESEKAQALACPSIERPVTARTDSSRFFLRRSSPLLTSGRDEELEGLVLYHVDGGGDHSPKRASNQKGVVGTVHAAKHPVETPNWGTSERERLWKGMPSGMQSRRQSQIVKQHTLAQRDTLSHLTTPDDTRYDFSSQQSSSCRRRGSFGVGQLHEKRFFVHGQEESHDTSAFQHSGVSNDAPCPPHTPHLEPSSLSRCPDSHCSSADTEKRQNRPLPLFLREDEGRAHPGAEPLQHTSCQVYSLVATSRGHGGRGRETGVGGKEGTRVFWETEKSHTATRVPFSLEKGSHHGEGKEKLQLIGQMRETEDRSANAHEGTSLSSAASELCGEESGDNRNVRVVRREVGRGRGKRSRDSSFHTSRGQQQTPHLERGQHADFVGYRSRNEALDTREVPNSSQHADSEDKVCQDVTVRRRGGQESAASPETDNAMSSQGLFAYVSSEGNAVGDGSRTSQPPFHSKRSTSLSVRSSPAFCRSRQDDEAGVYRERERASTTRELNYLPLRTNRLSGPSGMLPLEKSRSTPVIRRDDSVAVPSACTREEIPRKSEEGVKGRSDSPGTKQSSDSHGATQDLAHVFSPFRTTADPQPAEKNRSEENAVQTVATPRDTGSAPAAYTPSRAALPSQTLTSGARDAHRYEPAPQATGFSDTVPQFRVPGWRLCRNIFAGSSSDSPRSLLASQQEGQQDKTKAQQQRGQGREDHRSAAVRDKRTISAPPSPTLTRYGTGDDDKSLKRALAGRSLWGARSNLGSDPGTLHTERPESSAGLFGRCETAEKVAGVLDGFQEAPLALRAHKGLQQVAVGSPEEMTQSNRDLLLHAGDNRLFPFKLVHQICSDGGSPHSPAMVKWRSCRWPPDRMKRQVTSPRLDARSQPGETKQTVGGFHPVKETTGPATRGRVGSIPSPLVSRLALSPESRTSPEEKKENSAGVGTVVHLSGEVCREVNRGQRHSVQDYRALKTKSASFIPLRSQQYLYRRGSSSESASCRTGHPFHLSVEKLDCSTDNCRDPQSGPTASPRRRDSDKVSNFSQKNALLPSRGPRGSNEQERKHHFQHAKSTPVTDRSDRCCHPTSAQKSCSESLLPQLPRPSCEPRKPETWHHHWAREACRKNMAGDKSPREPSQEKACFAGQRRQREEDTPFLEGTLHMSAHTNGLYRQCSPYSEDLIGGGGVIKVLVCPPFAAPLPPRRTPSVSNGCCGVSGELFQRKGKAERRQGTPGTFVTSNNSEIKRSMALDVAGGTAFKSLLSLREGSTVEAGALLSEAQGEKRLHDEAELYGVHGRSSWSCHGRRQSGSPTVMLTPTTAASHPRSGACLLRDKECSLLADSETQTLALTRGEPCLPGDENADGELQVAASGSEATREKAESFTKRTETEGEGKETPSPTTKAAPLDTEGVSTNSATESLEGILTRGEEDQSVQEVLPCTVGSLDAAPVYLSEGLRPTALLVRKVVWQIRPARPVCACSAVDPDPHVCAGHRSVIPTCVSRVSQRSLRDQHVPAGPEETVKGASVSVRRGERGSLRVELFPCARCGGFPEAHIVNANQKPATGSRSEVESDPTASNIHSIP
ncbi:hypothetical protein CSUI_005874 [Cystoisospora suis]|uniref:Uncharacterized protein n=1 Tax=Cystoisospora suis TaxID=483139 RepID=A0A2C6KTP5_9APIC|nr:hypothetical protein CSUI_005874 [Cystoisospora suis]